MKHLLILALFFLPSLVYAQAAKVELSMKDNQKIIFITVEWEKGKIERYNLDCEFKDVLKLNDSTRITLLESLFFILDDNDTSTYYYNVMPLSFRYNGRFNRRPQSTNYNVQMAALVLINCVAFSSQAFYYSPFPVLYDKKAKKEFCMPGDELNDVIMEYRKWFERIKETGLKNFNFPLISCKYEWYGSLFGEQKLFTETPDWKRFFDCPKFTKEEY